MAHLSFIKYSATAMQTLIDFEGPSISDSNVIKITCFQVVSQRSWQLKLCIMTVSECLTRLHSTISYLKKMNNHDRSRFTARMMSNLQWDTFECRCYIRAICRHRFGTGAMWEETCTLSQKTDLWNCLGSAEAKLDNQV